MTRPLSRGALVLCLSAVVTACDRSITPPAIQQGERATAQIVDGSTAGGNAHFFFLPPLAKAPTYSGQFDASLEPVIEICMLAGASCDGSPVTYGLATNKKDGYVVDALEEVYFLQWKTPKNAPGTYRIRVLLNGVVIGITDVALLDNGKDANAVNPTEFVTATAGSMLPIKFRLEEGASIGADGGVLESPDGTVSLDIPPGALDGATTITIQPIANPPADPGLVPGTAHEFGPDGTHFNEAVEIALTFNPAQLPANVAPSRLRLHKLIGTLWQEVPGSTVDLVNNTVNGVVTTFSSYAIAASPGIYAGGEHTCSIDIAGVTRCWGANFSGQLGTGGPELETVPAVVSGGIEFATIASGVNHTCGLSTDGTAYCWGQNARAQLGIGTVGGIVTTPTAVATSEKFKAISATDVNTCAITADGRAFCWGGGNRGQLGNGEMQPVPVTASTPLVTQPAPVAVTMPPGVAFKSISAGASFTCALAEDGAAYCWGGNTAGQLGIGVFTPTATASGVPVPTAVVGGLGFLNLEATNGGFACGVTVDQDLYCWGDNAVGKLGSGIGPDQPAPLQVNMPLNFAAVRGGTQSACAITDNGSAYCWGFNWYGVVGNGSFLDTTVPSLVSGGIAFKSLATGDDHACGVAVDGKGYCWGHDGPGMLGNGTISDVMTPEVVLGGPYTAIASGQHHVCGLKASGVVNCAGRNINLSIGQTAATVVSVTPTPIMGSTVFQTLGTRNTFANCGLATVASGTNLFCWGGNHLGALGNNSIVDQASPVAVFGTRTYTAVAGGGDQNQPNAGSQFTCALASVASGVVNNNLWCWGLNTVNVNQLAAGSLSSGPRVIPIQSNVANQFFTKISLGTNYGCALTATGAAFCWGGNGSGQLGRGITSTGGAVAPVSGGRFFSTIAAGQNSTCAVELVTQDLYCWGANGAGQLGAGVTGGPVQTAPQLVAGGHKWIRTAVGNSWACGITTSNDMYCWGDNVRGQLGMGDHLDRNAPAAVSTSVKFATVNANFISTCGLATDGQAYCWGHKGFGRLGGGKIAYSNTPQLIVGGLGF